MKKSTYKFKLNDDKLVIKCAKECHIYNLFILIFTLVVGLLSYFEFNDLNITLYIIIPPLVILFRYWIVVGKTIIMSKECCTVQALFGRRTFRWNELKTKKIINFSNHFGTRQPYISGVVFSTGYIKNPLRLMPLDYNVFNVFTNGSIFNYFFVYFNPHLEYNSIQPDIYVVEESEFMKVMQDWDINIEKT